MTNDETAKGLSRGISSFGLRHSFGSRLPRRSRAKAGHWSFVIFSAARFMLVLALVIVVAIETSCTPGKRITKANVDQVAEGMSKKQVESILGTPTTINDEDFVIMKKTTYVYQQDKDTVTIVFKDDKVQSKESTLSE